jgi:hypothetical protein
MKNIYHVNYPYSFIISLLIIVFLNSIDALEEKKWGKVPDQFKEMKVFPDDTSAAAMKIFDLGKINLVREDKFTMYFERHYQIKILKTGGIKYGDIAIPYWHEDKVIELKAQTILPGGKKKKLEKKNIFDEEEKDFYRVKKFSLPAVETGSVIEVKYKLWSKYIRRLEPWVFQDDIPTVESAVSLRMSPGFIYNVLIKNDYNKRVINEEEPYIDPNHHNIILTEFIYRAENLPAVKEEPYISCLSNYKARLDFQIKKYSRSHVHHTFIKDLKTLCEEVIDSDFGTFFHPTGKVEKIVQQLLRETDPDETKIRVLYEYVRDHFDDENYYGTIYPRREQNEILEKNRASDSERNLLLLSMLLTANVNAAPVLISTRDHGWVDPEFPFLDQYNRTVVLVHLNNRPLLCDASDRLVPFGSLPFNSLGTIGLEITKEGHKFVKIPNAGIKGKENVVATIAISPEGVMKGEMKLAAYGYASQNHNHRLNKNPDLKDYLVKNLFDHFDDFKVLDADTTLKAAASDTFIISFEFETAGPMEVIDDELYLKPEIYYGENRNIFTSEKREFPVEFGYSFLEIEKTSFEFPEGFSVVELPRNVKIENKYISYSRMMYIVTENPLKVSYTRSFRVNELLVPSAFYKALKSDYAKIVDADQARIILKVNVQ